LLAARKWTETKSRFLGFPGFEQLGITDLLKDTSLVLPQVKCFPAVKIQFYVRWLRQYCLRHVECNAGARAPELESGRHG
jgi:hypothetical protein